MTKRQNGDQFNQNPPSEVRSTVTSGNQIHLPAFLVEELGFKSKKFSTDNGAIVAWYHHTEDDKAVLSNDVVDRPSLESVGVSALSGISNEELESGVEKGAKVTVISDLPCYLHERLTRAGGKVVLKPVYASECPELESTCVAVYPGPEYDSGELANVDSGVRIVANESGTSSNKKREIKKTSNHQNVI